MQRLIVTAAILLFLQLGLVLITYLHKRDLEPYPLNTKVVDFVPSVAEVLQITSAEGTLNLEKKEGKWLFSSAGKVPANGQLVQDFLGKIADLRRTLAVANSKSAAKRFKVSAADYEYHLLIKGSGKELANLYFGTSPGFKQMHLRQAGDDDIFTVNIASHELTSAVQQWIDRDVLKLASDMVQQVEIKGKVFKKSTESTWYLHREEATLELSVAKIDAMVDKLCNLSVSGYVTSAELDVSNVEADMVFSLVLTEGQKQDWRLVQAGEDDVVVFRSDKEYGLTVSKWQIDDLYKAVDDVFTPAQQQGTVEDVDKS